MGSWQFPYESFDIHLGSCVHSEPYRQPPNLECRGEDRAPMIGHSNVALRFDFACLRRHETAEAAGDKLPRSIV